MTFEEVLIYHLNKYPKSTYEDIYKLCFQSAFAGGHLILDKEKHLVHLKDEMNSVLEEVYKEVEPIGNHLYRIYLQGQKLSFETIHHMVIASANTHVLDKNIFLDQLEHISRLLKNQAWDNFLAAYKVLDYPLVSHSKSYKEAYDPHYRIINNQFVFYMNLFIKLDELFIDKAHVVIAIDGMTGSGKSMLAKLLLEVYEGTCIHLDDFFLQAHQRTPARFNEIGGNLDYERFMTDVLLNLEKPHFSYLPFDCQTMAFSKPIDYNRRKLTIIEGSYSMRPEFRPYYDLKIFLSVDADVQLQRIKHRNGIDMLDKFKSLWIPKENIYHQTFHLNKAVDMSFDTSYLDIKSIEKI